MDVKVMRARIQASVRPMQSPARTRGESSMGTRPLWLRAGLITAMLVVTAAVHAQGDRHMSRPAHAVLLAQANPDSDQIRAPEAPAPGKPPALLPTAPDRYTVRSADTLWSIASQYLQEPWRWPELFVYSSTQQAVADQIFPGQILVLDRAKTTLSVSGKPGGAAVPPGAVERPADAVEVPGNLPVERLSPRIRVAPELTRAVPSIPTQAIEPFLVRVLAGDASTFEKAASIVAIEESRSTVGPGQRIYARGLPPDSVGTDWQIYRIGRPLHDPTNGKILASEGIYVGEASVTRMTDPVTLVISRATMETTPGDRLLPKPLPQRVDFVPHAPALPVDARVIGTYGGRGEQSYLGSDLDTNRKDVGAFDARREAGPLQIVSINRGADDGLERGHVLALFRTSVATNDRSIGVFYMGKTRVAPVQLPEERYGLLMIFRTFDHLSYGLIVQAQRTVVAGDAVRQP